MGASRRALFQYLSNCRLRYRSLCPKGHKIHFRISPAYSLPVAYGHTCGLIECTPSESVWGLEVERVPVRECVCITQNIMVSTLKHTGKRDSSEIWSSSSLSSSRDIINVQHCVITETADIECAVFSSTWSSYFPSEPHSIS